MVVRFAPVGLNAECKSVEMHHEQLPEARPGDNVGFNIKGLSIKQINRGNGASDSKRSPARPVRRFLAQVIVLKHKQIKSGYTPVLDCHTAHIACKFNTVLSKLDARTGKTAAVLPSAVKTGDAAMVAPRPSPCASRPTPISPRSAASPCATCATPWLSASSRRPSSRNKARSRRARPRRASPSSPLRTTRSGPVSHKHLDQKWSCRTRSARIQFLPLL